LRSKDTAMKIAVCSTPEQYDQLLSRGVPVGVTVIMQSCDEPVTIEADIYIDLLFDGAKPVFGNITAHPVFVNEVIAINRTLPANFIRLNGWNSFLERDMLELAINDTKFFTDGTSALQNLGWKYQTAPDLPGMISARIIAMLINEAYFALAEDLSTKEEIDIAMRTGTNYPYGPFEWSRKIGLRNVYELLEELSRENERYLPAPNMAQDLIM